MINLPKKYVEIGFTAFQLKEIEFGFEHGLDENQVDLYAKEEFDNLQMKQIRLALEDGFNEIQIATFARPEMDWEMMEHARENIKNGNVIDETRVADLRKKNLKIALIVICIFSTISVAGILYFFSKDSLDQLFQKLDLTFTTNEVVEVKYGSGFNPRDFVKDYTKGRNVELVLPGKLDTKVLGEHTLTYVVKNQKKSISKDLKVKVVDKQAPILKLKQYSLSLERGVDTKFACKTYLEKAVDNVDGDLQEKVTCSQFDSNKDKQDIVYKVKDSSGNSSTAILKLNLKEKESVAVKEKIKYVPTPTDDKGREKYPSSSKGVGSTDFITKKFLFKDGYNLDSGYSACIAEGKKYGRFSCTPIKNNEGIYIGYLLKTN